MGDKRGTNCVNAGLAPVGGARPAAGDASPILPRTGQ